MRFRKLAANITHPCTAYGQTVLRMIEAQGTLYKTLM